MGPACTARPRTVSGMAARGHGAARRWAAVVGLVGVLVATPLVIGALPASDAAVSAADLRADVLASADVGFTGYAESAGGLALPVTDQLTSVADLFSDRTEMRVWWRGADDHRVDVITAGRGDRHLPRPPRGTWTWEYERATATRGDADAARAARPARPAAHLAGPPAAVRGDRRGADPDRRPTRRRPGRRWASGSSRPSRRRRSAGSTSGWTPTAACRCRSRSSRRARTAPALDTRFLDLEVGRPSAEVTAFTPPTGSSVRQARRGRDRARGRAADRPRCRCRTSWPGCRAVSSTASPPGIGLYGRGVTLLAVAPVPAGLARGAAQRARAGTRRRPGRRGHPAGRRAGRRSCSWRRWAGAAYVLTGTVTLDALAEAAAPAAEARRRDAP